MPGILSSPPDGLKEGYVGNGNATKIAMTVMFAIALYNSLELIILIFVTFKHYRGLYFWSLLLSTVLGVIPHAVGFILNFFNVATKWVAIMISTIGWYFMVPGQSFVLYSRLYLVLHNHRVLRRILFLIIFDTIILIIPTTILTFGTVYIDNVHVNKAFNVMERLQVTWFFAQECFISLLYIWETIRLFRLEPHKDRRRVQIKYELIIINIAIIVMDIVLLVMEYINWYIIQTTLKTTVYSVKLKLEFGVLSRLVSVVNIRHPDEISTERSEFPNFVNPSRLTSDVTHAMPTEDNFLQRRQPWADISVDSLPVSERSGHPIRSFDASRPADT